MTKTPRIYLSSPHMGSQEQEFVREAFETNWLSPLGPNVDGFEAEFANRVGSQYAAALSSGTAALHLALIIAGVEPGDEVVVSSLTFVASVNPIRYVGATPVFIDSEKDSWNLDPELLDSFLKQRAKVNRLPKAVMVVHLYGQTANMDPIMETCRAHGVMVIEDAAEALGADYRGRSPGSFGHMGIFSFNGNKIITTSGGGMLVSDDESVIARARKLATQARDPAPHYQHTEIGYNYRLSNVLAGIGRGQLQVLEERVLQRRANFDFYVESLSDLPGVTFQPEAEWGRHTRWLTCLTVNPAAGGSDRETIRTHLESLNIEARPVWKPMHLQPLYSGYEVVGGEVADGLFEFGLCLPSGSNLKDEEKHRVVAAVRSCF
jgi:dTDP-4-amino-4,6-dideoxygalactose transaminase